MKLSSRISSLGPIWYAHLWKYYYRCRNSSLAVAPRFRLIFTILVLPILISISCLLVSEIRSGLETYFSIQDRFSGFRTLLVTLGSALIGATAIAFSLIMFAMQVNIVRMPYGVFRKLSSDTKLISSFAATFLSAIAITCFSLIPDKSWVTLATLVAMWASVFIPVFLFIAYRRVLDLISPIKQLSMLVEDATRSLDVWARAAQKAAILIKHHKEQNGFDVNQYSEYDNERAAYFLRYPQWTTVALRGISHCISFSRRYAEQGDYEVSEAALDAICTINTAYIRAKGKTFVAYNFLIDSPLATDGFINDTLEHLRQNVQLGVSRGDEQQIEQIFKAMLRLCQIYLDIDYASKHASKTHAHLASAYLAGAVEAVVPQDMPDVLMEGVKKMGTVAQLILHYKEPEHIINICEKIALIACTGAIKEKYRPVTQIGVMELAKRTFELILSEERDVKSALHRIREDIGLIADVYLKIPDTPLSSAHSASLAPYYSSTSSESFTVWLTELANTISDAKGDDKSVQNVIYHLSQWADGLSMTEKDLFLSAIEKKSHLTFDIVHWIAHITEILLAVSNAGACDDHNRTELRRHALWLISVFSWVPDNKETVIWVEGYQMTEILFEAATKAKKHSCDDIATDIRGLLLAWAFKAGKYESGWGTLETVCYGLACLNIILNLNDDALLEAIEKEIGRDDSFGIEIRVRTSEQIQKKASKSRYERYPLRSIEAAMAQVDQDRLRTLLFGIASKLTMDTVVTEPEGKTT